MNIIASECKVNYRQVLFVRLVQNENKLNIAVVNVISIAPN